MNKKLYEQMIRVNHAGEYGNFQYIYSQDKLNTPKIKNLRMS